MWAIVSMLLPWSTLALVGGVVYLWRTNRKLIEAGEARTQQVRALQGLVNSYQAHVAELLLRIDTMRRAAEEASKHQANAASAALQAANGADEATNFKNLTGLLDG